MNSFNAKSLSIRDPGNRKWWIALGALVVGVALSGCGGSSKSASTASVRMANATLTHSSLDLWINSAVASSGITTDTVSAYATPASGGAVLQVDDAGSTSGLATLAPTLTGDYHYTLLAYESGSTLRSVLVAEDWPVPASGATTLHVRDVATEAGKLDVYITPAQVAQAAELSALSPVGSFISSTTELALTYSPGSYYLTVTGSGTPGDIRLLNMPITLTNQEVATVALTPASGGQLLNAAFVIQQGAYSTFRNTGTRVRLASAVSGSATVAALATAAGSSVTIDSGSVAPQFGSYVLVTKGSALNVSVNGASVAAPATALLAGGDMTLLVYGSPDSPTASLLTDDNRQPTDSTSIKLRLINGVTGNSANALTLTANSATVASSVAADTVSAYASVAASLNPMNLSLYSSQKAGVFYSNSSYVLPANGVYTVLLGGDFSSPLMLIR